LIPLWGEERSLTIGLYFYALCFFAFGVAPTEWLLYLTILIFSLTGIAMPSLQSMMTREVPANEQGELQGSLVSLGSLSSVLAPLIFTPVYVYFTTENNPYFFPGAGFVLASVLSLLTVFVWLYHQRRTQRG
jgi:DHA1 family tetracycline resistance protein-like MFS transporter